MSVTTYWVWFRWRGRWGARPEKDDFGAWAEVGVDGGVTRSKGGATNIATAVVNNNEDNCQIIGGHIISNTTPSDDTNTNTNTNTPTQTKTVKEGVTLLLFYQYIEPILSEPIYQTLIAYTTAAATKHSITGQMRVAREGINCTLESPLVPSAPTAKTDVAVVSISGIIVVVIILQDGR